MREAYLTGGQEHFDATDAPAETQPEQAFEPIYLFDSAALLDYGHLKLSGGRHLGFEMEEFTISRNRSVHPDLLKCLRKLTLHLCLLTEQYTDQQLYPGIYGLPTDEVNARLQLRAAVESGAAYEHELLEKFRCTGVTWKNKGVVLSGTRQTRYRFNKDLEFKTPVVIVMVGLDDENADELGEYPFFKQLDQTLQDLRAELLAYMNGKYGEGGEQLSLFGKDAPTPTVLEAMDTLNAALDSELSKRRQREAADLESATLAATEAALEQAPAKKRKARRTADKKGGTSK